MASSVEELESQLADVDTLLQATPDDPSLVSLRSDLLELLQLSRAGAVDEAVAAAPEESAHHEPSAPQQPSVNVLEQALEAAVGRSVGVADETAATTTAAASAETGQTAGSIEAAEDPSSTTASEPSKKKRKKVKDFEVPEHLIPLDTDTEAERNKKRRTLKSLKSKWREQKKEIETEKKQKSWQSFQKKKGVKDSIFSTEKADSKKLTEFGERKRHKHHT